METTFAPASGKTSGVIKSAFKQPHLATNVDVDLAGPTVHGAAVLGYEGTVELRSIGPVRKGIPPITDASSWSL